MKLSEIQNNAENIKCELWAFCEDEKTSIQKETKKAMNLLLDYIDLLIEESED